MCMHVSFNVHPSCHCKCIMWIHTCTRAHTHITSCCWRLHGLFTFFKQLTVSGPALQIRVGPGSSVSLHTHKHKHTHKQTQQSSVHAQKQIKTNNNNTNHHVHRKLRVRERTSESELLFSDSLTREDFTSSRSRSADTSFLFSSCSPSSLKAISSSFAPRSSPSAPFICGMFAVSRSS